MTFDEIEVGGKYKLIRPIQFYNSRSGMFAYFDVDLSVEVTRKCPGHTATCMVKFPGALFEILPSNLALDTE